MSQAKKDANVLPRTFILVALISNFPLTGFAAEVVPSPEKSRKAVERGLDFLLKDAAKWRKERECSTCHHGVMTVWALCEAKRSGYVPADATAAMAKWNKDRLPATIDQPGDKRPGWNMVSTPAPHPATMAQTVPVRRSEALEGD